MSENSQPVNAQGFADAEFQVRASGKSVLVLLGEHGTIKLTPGQALEMGRALKSAALLARGR